MTDALDKVRAAFERAKAWKLEHWCNYYALVRKEFCGDDQADHDCSYCLGARRAAEDVALCLENAMLAARDGRIDESYVNSATSYAERAETIEGYFGAPGCIAAFAAAVKEACE